MTRFETEEDREHDASMRLSSDDEPVDMRRYSLYIETAEDKRANRAILLWLVLFFAGSIYLVVQGFIGAIKGENPLAYSIGKLLELRNFIEATLFGWLQNIF